MSTTNKKFRVYGKLRDIIERCGGQMVYQRQGYRWGAWKITLDSKSATIPSEGRRTFPHLDRLYVPKVAKPKTWDDYRNELVPGAQEKLCSLPT